MVGVIRLSCSAAMLVAAFLTASCAVRPRALTEEESRATALADRNRIAAQVPALEGELSLSEAIARALKYNLDHRTKLLEQSYAAGALRTSYYDMLPALTGSVDYSTRNNDATRRSVDSVTGEPDDAHPFISSSRTHTVTQLGISWSILDLGVSYYNARQQADRVLAASERRRKAMHELIQNVESLYCRALSAQKLGDPVRKAIAAADTALADARQVETERLKSPMESLRYQRALLENLRTLESVQQELAVAQLELARLVNLPADGMLRLADAAAEEHLPVLDRPLDELEVVALVNNADLREERYNARIAALEARKSLVKLLPGLNLSYGGSHDTDDFLINKDWVEAGVGVTANLLQALSMPARRSLREAGERVSEARRMALEMAVVTQVHVAAFQFSSARRLFERADEIWRVDERMLALTASAEAAQTDSQLSRIASQTAAILSLLRRYQALATLHAAHGRIQATLGLEPRIESLDTMELPELVRRIEREKAL